MLGAPATWSECHPLRMQLLTRISALASHPSWQHDEGFQLTRQMTLLCYFFWLKNINQSIAQQLHLMRPSFLPESGLGAPVSSYIYLGGLYRNSMDMSTCLRLKLYL